mgnify:CR=1 FL=1
METDLRLTLFSLCILLSNQKCLQTHQFATMTLQIFWGHLQRSACTHSLRMQNTTSYRHIPCSEKNIDLKIKKSGHSLLLIE